MAAHCERTLLKLEDEMLKHSDSDLIFATLRLKGLAALNRKLDAIRRTGKRIRSLELTINDDVDS